MPSADDGSCFFFAGHAGYFNVELFFDVLFQTDLDGLCFNHFFTGFNGFRRAVFQHFQLVFRFSDQCSQGNGNGESDHVRSGNTYTHGIFQNIGAEQHLYFLWTLV